jgi:anaphase-promoting complex subunit 3
MQNVDNLSVKINNIILELFRKLGLGYKALAGYESQNAIDAFNRLSDRQRNSPWVLTNTAKAYYELAKYKEARLARTVIDAKVRFARD